MEVCHFVHFMFMMLIVLFSCTVKNIVPVPIIEFIDYMFVFITVFV